jgi:glycosyltransferase involved in cell wall biosynthesis
VIFRFITANTHPNHETIAIFRKWFSKKAGSKTENWPVGGAIGLNPTGFKACSIGSVFDLRGNHKGAPMPVSKDVVVRPMFSVVMSNYNYEDYVCDAVASVQYEDPGSVEVIVVDDGSTDLSTDRLRRLSRANLFLIEQSNQGQSAALNLAVSKARGKYIFFLDSDDLFVEEKLWVYKAVLEECSSNFSLMFDNFVPFCPGGRQHICSSPVRRRNWSIVDPRLDLESNGGRLRYFPPTSTIMMPRSVVSKVFPLNVEVKISADGPMVTRAALIGKFVHVHHPLTKYRVHQSNNRGLWAASVQQLEKCISDFVAIKHDIERFSRDCNIELASDLYQCEAYVDLNAKKELLSNGRLHPSTRMALARLSLMRHLIYRMFDIVPSATASKLFSFAYEFVGRMKYAKYG